MASSASARVFPRWLLHDPVVVQALRTRNFGAVFAIGKAANLSFNAIAAATGLKAERISLVARGEARITALDTIERIADGLRLPGALLGLAARPWESDTDVEPQPAREDESMHRREILRTTLAAGLTAAPLNHLADVLAKAEHVLAVAGPADLTHLEAATAQHSYGYSGRVPTDVLADLITDVADVVSQLQRSQPTATWITLTRIMGQLGGMTAVVLHDLGKQGEATAWFATAARSAEQAGDQNLHAWILARKAMVPLNFGAPRAAADLAEQARHVAGTAPTAAATLAAAVTGRAYALAGRRDEAAAALRDADQLASQLPEAERADTWFGHCEQKHHVHLSHGLTALGEIDRARESQAHALALSAPTSTLTRTLIQLDAATCLHRDGHSLDACEAATAVLTELPASHHTGLARSRAVDLYRSIPTDLRSEPAARAFADVLAASKSG